MNIWEEAFIRKAQYNSRRHFLKKCTSGLGALAMGSLMGCGNNTGAKHTAASLIDKKASHFAPKAKSVIFLHMAGDLHIWSFLISSPHFKN